MHAQYSPHSTNNTTISFLYSISLRPPPAIREEYHHHHSSQSSISVFSLDDMQIIDITSNDDNDY